MTLPLCPAVAVMGCTDGKDWLSPLLSWLERAIPQDAMDSGVSWDEMKTKVGRRFCSEWGTGLKDLRWM